MIKTILITGAGTGIGRDAAFRLAERGHHVLATTHTQLQVEALRAEAHDRRRHLDVFKLDITASADRTNVDFRAVDVLINNAAVGDSGSLAEVDIDRIRQTFDVNLFGTLALTQLALKEMIAREHGTVIFVSSIAGRVPIPFLMPYAMTKFAISAAAAALRTEMDMLGKHVNVCVIEPGAIHTGFNQAMTNRKYEWMQTHSYFADKLDRIRSMEARAFAIAEASTTRSVVAAFVKAAEARRPKLRYVAPWIQGVLVQLARMAGV